MKVKEKKISNIDKLDKKLKKITQVINWLKEGKKLSCCTWEKDEYMFLNDKKVIVLENDEVWDLVIDECLDNN